MAYMEVRQGTRIYGRKTIQKPSSGIVMSRLFLAALASTATIVSAQNCIPLSASAVCPAFHEASISTDTGLVSSYPFLARVSSVRQFDDQLTQYIATDYAQLKYEQLLGCSKVDLRNTTNFYARYTASVICNAIVQNSRKPCSLPESSARPLCADSCADQAISEQEIIASRDICGNPRPNAMDQIRADFTVCSLPGNSLNGNCVTGAQNEPVNCGYSDNLIGLCSYCASSSPNATDSCCVNSKVTTRCDNVNLPSTTSLPPLFPSSSSTSAPSSTASTSSTDDNGLSGGQIAGIVIGSVIGAALLIGLLICCCLRRRKRGSQKGSVFNQPSPPRQGGSSMTYNPVGPSGPPQQGYEVLPGGRIARMSALEGPSSDSPPHGSSLAGGMSGRDRRRHQDTSSSSGYGESPNYQVQSARDVMAPPPLGRRTGSLSSGSALAGEGPNSPQSGSAGQFSSPEGVASGQSEQLDVFKDYYSQEEIHPNDKVATLWAYEPRASDEFRLERGDMLKVVGIWDDGWATGVRLNERAEDWDVRRRFQRDSGVSNGSSRRTSSPPPPGEIKAFPLVCVCLPKHWKKTIEGDGSTDTSSSGGPLPSSGP